MLCESVGELDAFVKRVLSNVSYPKRHVQQAASAAKLIRWNYESMLQNIGGNLASFSTIVNAAQGASSKINASGLASIAGRIARAQGTAGENQALMASVQSALGEIGVIQTAELSPVLETVGRQAQLHKMVSEEVLASITRPAVSVDYSVL